MNMTSEDRLVWAAMVEMPIGMNPGHRSMLIVATDDLGAITQQRFFTPVDEVGSPVYGPHHVASGGGTANRNSHPQRPARAGQRLGTPRQKSRRASGLHGPSDRSDGVNALKSGSASLRPSVVANGP